MPARLNGHAQYRPLPHNKPAETALAPRLAWHHQHSYSPQSSRFFHHAHENRNQRKPLSPPDFHAVQLLAHPAKSFREMPASPPQFLSPELLLPWHLAGLPKQTPAERKIHADNVAQLNQKSQAQQAQL